MILNRTGAEDCLLLKNMGIRKSATLSLLGNVTRLQIRSHA